MLWLPLYFLEIGYGFLNDLGITWYFCAIGISASILWVGSYHGIMCHVISEFSIYEPIDYKLFSAPFIILVFLVQSDLWCYFVQ